MKNQRAKNPTCEVSKNPSAKLTCEILNQLQLSEWWPLFLFLQGGLFKLQPEWWDATSSTRHHRLRVRQPRTEIRLVSETVAIKCEGVVRKRHKDDVQAHKWLECTFVKIFEVRHESGPKRPRWNARQIPCLAEGPPFLQRGTATVRLSFELSQRKAIGWARFAIA